MKAWNGIDFSDDKHTEHNVIVNQNFMNHYCLFWKDRNEKRYDKDVQRKK